MISENLLGSEVINDWVYINMLNWIYNFKSCLQLKANGTLHLIPF